MADFLYPFLGEGTDPSVEEVRRSTRLKFDEGIELRRQLERESAEEAAADLTAVFRAGGRLFTMGNGGSATDASDCARAVREVLRKGAVALCEDEATVTALANDVGFETVFARPLAALARPGDALLAFSTSGNSANLGPAFEVARRLGLLTLAMTGSDGGTLARSHEQHGCPRHLVFVRSFHVPRIQEAHCAAYHRLLRRVEELLSA
ncbi:MAG: SIS domain-containing protein [Candidatus Eremiobacterota bacterium]